VAACVEMVCEIKDEFAEVLIIVLLAESEEVADNQTFETASWMCRVLQDVYR